MHYNHYFGTVLIKYFNIIKKLNDILNVVF